MAIDLYSAPARNKLTTLVAPNPSVVWAFCFTPDGTQLAAAIPAQRSVQLWDLRAIRAQLASLQLDWNLPPYPADDRRDHPATLRLQIVDAPLANSP